MPVTIKDIAAEAGVSYQAVSAVLNGKTNCRVSSSRREHILSIAREMGYRTNFGYKLMHGKTTRTVAIISAMRRIGSDEHIRYLIMALMQRMNQKGFATYFNNMMTPDGAENLRQIRDLITRGTEHFIFLGSPVGHEAIERELVANGRTLVGLSSDFRRNIGMDSRGASLELFKFLRERTGGAPLLILPGRDSLGGARFLGLRDLCPGMTAEELAERQVIFTPELTWEEKNFNARAFELGYQGMLDALARRREGRPLAVAYLNDHFALGGAVCCFHRHLEVGRDVFISGFNNDEAVCFSPFPIASAAHPVEAAVDIVSREMASDGELRVTIPLKLFMRPE